MLNHSNAMSTLRYFRITKEEVLQTYEFKLYIKWILKIPIETEPRGSAILFREPHLIGSVLFYIVDSIHDNCKRLYICDSTDVEHEKNMGLALVSEVAEEVAVKLAAEYQPERLMTCIDPITGETKNLPMPACDLRLLLTGGQTGAIGGDLLREQVS